MSLAQLLNRPVTLSLRAATVSTDRYGNDIPGDPTLVDTVGELQQVRRTEPGLEGELSVTEWRLFLPAGTDIDTGDTVMIDADVFEVVGDPWDARNPRTQIVSHVEATLKRTAVDEGGS